MDPAVPPQETHPPRIPKLSLFLAMLSLFLLVSTVYLMNQNAHLKKQIVELSKPIPTPIESPTPLSPLNLETRVVDAQNKTGWKTFQGDYYEISFPSSWTFKGPIGSDSGFPQAIALISPTKNSELQIGTKYSFPFGGGPNDKSTDTPVAVRVGSLTFQGTETKNGSSSYTRVQTNHVVSFSKTNEPIFIIFGNDYPLFDVRAGETTAYAQEKAAILEILSTFKFLDQTVKTESKTGHITSITTVYVTYNVVLQYTNGQSVTLPIEQNPEVRMQTYSHAADGNFQFNQQITFGEFLKLFSDNTLWKNYLYQLELRNGTVTKISEVYQP